MPTHSGNTLLLVTDQQNSVLSAVGETGVDAIPYTAYGHSQLDDSQSRLRFNGEFLELGTGHYPLGKGYRMYNPVLMRFNSPDSWSPFGRGGWNTYGYCGGDSVNRIDPTGHFWGIGKFFRSIFGLKPKNAKSASSLSVPAKAAVIKQIGKGSGPTPRLSSTKINDGLGTGDLNDLNYSLFEPRPASTTRNAVAPLSGQQANIETLGSSAITRKHLLNRRSKSVSHSPESFQKDLEAFYLSREFGPDGGFLTTQFAADPFGRHGQLYAAMTSELSKFPTQEIQRIIRRGA